MLWFAVKVGRHPATPRRVITPSTLRLDALDRHREYGAIFIRLLVGGTLIYMS